MSLLLYVVVWLQFPSAFSRVTDFQIIKRTNENGTLERTIILPVETKDLVLISTSSTSHGKSNETVRKNHSTHGSKKYLKRRRRRNKLRHPEDPSLVSRVSKFLNLLTIVQFPNEACANNGGTCFHELECSTRGGTPGAPCARGYGVCCQFQAKCGEKDTSMEKMFTKSRGKNECSLDIVKSNCTKQIRLDFLKLELGNPESGNCMNERLIITGHNKNSPVPTICGSNTGQHVYIDVDDVLEPLKITVISDKSKDFKIKFTQLCESSPLLAPKHCLQYFQDSTGVVQSFNYATANPTGYLNNLNYAICIKKGKDMCSIMYSNDQSENGFDIVNIDSDGTPIVPEGEAGAEVFNCPDDYITVKSIRLCGQKMNDASREPDFTKDSPILDASSGPFVMAVVTDSAVTGRGFRLFYKQNPCQN